MAWLEENLAALSGVLAPLLVVVVKPLMERESGGIELRRIRRHARVRALLPEGGEAASKLDELLAAEVDHITSRAMQRMNRKIDGGMIGMMITSSVVGGAISFGLVTWAQDSNGIWAWILWIICAIWTLFLLVFVLVGGLSNLYQKVEDDSGAAP